MYSKVKLFGHPIHPMLVAYPIAFYTANLAGVAMAVLAALPGFIDWALGIPGDTEAKAVGLRHLLLNVGALALFIVLAVLNTGSWNAAAPSAAAGIALALLGVLLTVAAGAHGWTLIQTHHVGVGPGAAPERAGPRGA